MNLLFAMLWAWVGVSAASVLAAAVIVLAELSVGEQELANKHEIPSMSLMCDGGQSGGAHMRGDDSSLGDHTSHLR